MTDLSQPTTDALNAKSSQQVDEAIDDVGRNAGPEWGETALECVLAYARSADSPFLSEDVRNAYADTIGRPHDGRAWGHVMRRAARLGAIRKVGYAAARTSNGTPKSLWEPLKGETP